MTHRQYFKAVDPSVLCPIAGYTSAADLAANYTLNTDIPALLPTVCPAAGYVDPNDPSDPWTQVYPPYVPEVGLPVIAPPTGNDSIIMICTTELGGFVQAYVYVSTGNIIWKLYGADDTLLDTITSTATSQAWNLLLYSGGYVLPNGVSGFKIVVTAATGRITQFRQYSNSTIYPIFEVYVNAPLITGLDFYGMKTIKKIWMCDTMDLLNTSMYLFKDNSDLVDLKMPLSMAIQDDIDNWFYGTTLLKKAVLPANMPALVLMQYSFNYSGLVDVTLPQTVAAVTKSISLYSTFNYMPNIQTIQIPEKWAADGVSIVQTASFAYNPELIRVIFPSGLLMKSTHRIFERCYKIEQDSGTFYAPITDESMSQSNYQYCYKLKKIIYLYPNVAGTFAFTNLFTSSGIEEIIMPENCNGISQLSSSIFGISPALKKIGLPKSMTGLSGALTQYIGGSSCTNVEEITTCNNWGTNLLTIQLYPTYNTKLVRFDQPTLRCKGISLYGQSLALAGSCNYVEIAWEYVTESINLKWIQLSASELNRIMNRLPAIVGKAFSISGNPGYATCNVSIATAKGWTVN